MLVSKTSDEKFSCTEMDVNTKMSLGGKFSKLGTLFEIFVCDKFSATSLQQKYLIELFRIAI